MNKKILITILTILGLAIIAGGFWYVKNQQKENVVIKEKQEQNRQMNNEKENENQKQEEQKDENNEELDFEKIDTSNWKEYCNKEYGFCVKYPEKLEISSKSTENNNIVFSTGVDDHWIYNIKIYNNKNNLSLEAALDKVLTDTKSSMTSRSYIHIGNVKAVKFVDNNHYDYGNTGIVFVYGHNIVGIFGDTSTDKNMSEFEKFYNSLTFLNKQ